MPTTNKFKIYGKNATTYTIPDDGDFTAYENGATPGDTVSATVVNTGLKSASIVTKCLIDCLTKNQSAASISAQSSETDVKNFIEEGLASLEVAKATNANTAKTLPSGENILGISSTLSVYETAQTLDGVGDIHDSTTLTIPAKTVCLINVYARENAEYGVLALSKSGAWPDLGGGNISSQVRCLVTGESGFWGAQWLHASTVVVNPSNTSSSIYLYRCKVNKTRVIQNFIKMGA